MDLCNVFDGSCFSTKIPESLMTKVLPFYGTAGKLKVKLIEHIDKEDVVEMLKNMKFIKQDKTIIEIVEEFINEEFELYKDNDKIFLIDYHKSVYDYKDHPLMQEPLKIQKMLKDLQELKLLVGEIAKDFDIDMDIKIPNYELYEIIELVYKNKKST